LDEGCVALGFGQDGATVSGVARRFPTGVLVRPERIERAVADLNAIYIKGQLETVCRMGRYLVEHFGGGDVQRYLEHGRLTVSYRSLAAREDLLVSASLLNRCVGIMIQVRRLPPEQSWALTVTHHRILLPVCDPEVQQALAREVVQQGLSTRQLEARVKSWKDEHLPERRGGARCKPAVIRGLEGSVRAVESMLELEVEQALDGVDVEQLAVLVARLRARLPALEATLAGLERAVR
jgi:hypothetical protein